MGLFGGAVLGAAAGGPLGAGLGALGGSGVGSNNGMVNSLEQFAGMAGGPQAPMANSNNPALHSLNEAAGVYNNGDAQNSLKAYGLGDTSLAGALQTNVGSPEQQGAFRDMLATDPLTGSKMATEQVQGNPILGQLYGDGGQLSKEVGQYGDQSSKLSDLQNQGFELKPEDQSLYGQMSGNIARQFGQQGNQTASNLASRGLSSSGAAGAAFSGLQGNQNEMLAQAQQQIAQQRFQNTMQQIGQQQQFISGLGQNINNMGNSAENAINQQYGRNQSGVQQKNQGLQATAGLNNAANGMANNYGLTGAAFNAENQPKNVMDFATAGAGQGIQSGTAGLFSKGPAAATGGAG